MNIVVAKYDRLHTLLLIRMRYPMAQALLHLPLLPVELVFGCVIPWGMHYHLAVKYVAGLTVMPCRKVLDFGNEQKCRP